MASDDAVRVICRFRPLNSSERARNDEYLPTYTETSVRMSNKSYNFDLAFDDKTHQKTMYEGSAQPVVQEVLKGFNGTIFAYGQTGSGKTHSMDGVIHDEELRGIIPRIIQEIFEQVQDTVSSDIEVLIRVSYVEIYMEKIRDLLNPRKKDLKVRETKQGVPYVENVTWANVSEANEVMAVMDDGKLNRTVATTKMNAGSSRSHSIFTIAVGQKNINTKEEKEGVLNLVDLAGSEKIAKTEVSGTQLEEAKKINLSLSALGNVMAALTNPEPNTFIPYRSSCLTRMLQNSLGGNCKTTMIICCSPSSYNEPETKSTMAFGVRAKSIKNSVTANVVLTAEQWEKKFDKLEGQKNRLEKKLIVSKKELEKWRAGETVPEDQWGEIAEEQNETEIDIKANLTQITEISETSESDYKSDPYRDSIKTASEISIPAFGKNICSACKGESDNRKEIVLGQDDKDFTIRELTDQIRVKNDTVKTLTKSRDEFKEQVDDLIIMLEESADNPTQAIPSENVKELELERDQMKQESAEIMQALEDMAQSYDTKEAELAETSSKAGQIGQELQATKNNLQKLQAEMANKDAIVEQERSNNANTLNYIISDINEMGMLNNEAAENENDEFTQARLMVSKIKAEVKSLKDKCIDLELKKDDAATAAKSTEMAESKLKLTKQKNQISTLSACLKDIEAKRRNLEDQISDQNETIARLQTAELTRENSSIDNSDEVKHALELQKVQHKEQIERIREEIDSKNTDLETLREEGDRMKAELDDAQEKNKEGEFKLTDLSNKLKGFQISELAKKQAQTDLNSLQETTGRELANLSSLRKKFVDTLLENSRNKTDDKFSATGVQRQRIEFLENNLNQLTNAHKSLVQDNTDLKSELPKLQKRNQSMMGRVQKLEQELRNAKERSMKDRQTYQAEVDKIKEQVRQKYMQKKRQISAIAKPIRGGQSKSYGTSTFQMNR